MDAVLEMLSKTENMFLSDADKLNQNIKEGEKDSPLDSNTNTIDLAGKNDSLSRTTTLHDSPDSTSPSSKSNPSQILFLTNMPVDFIFEMSKSLPLSSLVALSLTSKTMLSLIGSEVWEELRKPKNESQLWEFLALLDKDLPNHRVCYVCDTLHKRLPLNEASRYLYVPMHQFTNCSVRSGEILLWPHVFTFQQVQLVMRSYRFSSPEHGFPLGSLARSYRARNEHNHITEHVIVRPRISVDDELLIERKHIFSIKTTGKLQHNYENGRITVSLPFDLELLDLSPCKHREAFLSQQPAVVSTIICVMYHRASLKDESQCRVCQPIRHHCRACQTYWEVDPLRTWQWRNRTMVTITTWRNLGECKNPYDWRWRRHLESSRWPQDAPREPPVAVSRQMGTYLFYGPSVKDQWEKAGDNGVRELRRYI